MEPTQEAFTHELNEIFANEEYRWKDTMVDKIAQHFKTLKDCTADEKWFDEYKEHAFNEDVSALSVR